MPSWWDSLEAVTRFNILMQWLAASLAIFAGIAGVLILVSGSRLSELQGKQAEAKEAEAARALLELQERTKPRTLSPEQRARLVEVFKARRGGAGFGPEISVRHVPGNNDSRDFALQLVEVFREADWGLWGQVGIADPDIPTFSGLCVVVSGGANLELSEFVRRALIDVGLETSLLGVRERKPGFIPPVPDETVVLVVGLRP